MLSDAYLEQEALKTNRDDKEDAAIAEEDEMARSHHSSVDSFFNKERQYPVDDFMAPAHKVSTKDEATSGPSRNGVKPSASNDRIMAFSDVRIAGAGNKLKDFERTLKPKKKLNNFIGNVSDGNL